ncbi:MAG TPA: hypothetical protein VNO56_06380 [Gaiellaceae bacterium]|nr:hypothetical protein [Gaiellaceae bacterium]
MSVPDPVVAGGDAAAWGRRGGALDPFSGMGSGLTAVRDLAREDVSAPDPVVSR